jgi:hypothetical protein
MRKAFVSLLITTVACLTGITASAGPPSSTDVQVMTQNQYVGADLFPLIPALASGDPSISSARVHRGAVTRNGVHATGRQGPCDQPEKSQST